MQDEFPFINAEDLQRALLDAAQCVELTTLSLRETA